MSRSAWAGICAIPALVAATEAQAGGLFLYEMATPDLGTASAGRAAATDNAATAFGNPAGMTRLDQSQMLVGIQPAYGISHFDKDNETTVSGGNGGNALGFIPGLGGYYVYSATPDLKFGLSLGSDFGLSARYQSNWSGRYYAQQEEIITLGAFPVAAYRINPWLSIGAGAQIIYGKLNSKTGINDVLRRRRRQHRRLQPTTSAMAASPAFSSSRSRAPASASPTPPRSSSTSRKSPRPTISGRGCRAPWTPPG